MYKSILSRREWKPGIWARTLAQSSCWRGNERLICCKCLSESPLKVVKTSKRPAVTLKCPTNSRTPFFSHRCISNICKHTHPSCYQRSKAIDRATARRKTQNKKSVRLHLHVGTLLVYHLAAVEKSRLQVKSKILDEGSASLRIFWMHLSILNWRRDPDIWGTFDNE